MANHKSAKKRARQNDVRRVRNKSRLSEVRTAVKKFRLGLGELKSGSTDAAKVQTLLTSAQSALQKAASKGLLHRNNASRSVGRLAQALSKAKAGK